MSHISQKMQNHRCSGCDCGGSECWSGKYSKSVLDVPVEHYYYNTDYCFTYLYY